MALTKDIEIGGSFLPDGQIQIYEDTVIKEDGVEISRTRHRRVIDVDDDVSNEPQIIRDVAQGLFTPQRIAARKAAKAQQRN